MRRQSFRSRPLDIRKAIKVVKSVSGIVFEDENGNKRHVAADSMGTVEKKIITYNIPIPVIKTVPGYESQVKPDFAMSSHYIRHKRATEFEIQRNTLYNLVHEDRVWLKNNPLIGPNGTLARISPSKLEEMLDVFAKENQLRSRSTTKSRAALTQADAEEIMLTRLRLVGPASAKIAAEVRAYWEAKMKKLKKSLLRVYWPQTSESDVNPHHTFRSMEKPNVPNLRPFRRHKGMEAFLFMEALRNDLETTRRLLTHVKKREDLKRRILTHHRELLEQSVFDTATQSIAKAASAAAAAQMSSDAASAATLPAPSAMTIVQPVRQRPIGVDLQSKAPKMPRFRLKFGGKDGTSLSKQAVALSTPLVPSFLCATAFPGSRSMGEQTLPPAIETWPPQVPLVDYGGIVDIVDDEDTSSLTESERQELDSSVHSLAGTERTFVCRGRIGRGGRYIVDRIPCRKKLTGSELADSYGVDKSSLGAKGKSKAARKKAKIPLHLQHQKRKRGRPTYARPPCLIATPKPVHPCPRVVGVSILF